MREQLISTSVTNDKRGLRMKFKWLRSVSRAGKAARGNELVSKHSIPFHVLDTFGIKAIYTSYYGRLLQTLLSTTIIPNLQGYVTSRIPPRKICLFNQD
jgi:hypothetical protein